MNKLGSKETEFDLTELISILWGRKWLILFSVVISVAVAMAYLRLAPKVYQADLLLKVDKSGGGIGAAILGDLEGAFDNGSGEIDTQIKIINSRAILGQIVDRFNLEVQLKPHLQLKSLVTPPKHIPKMQIVFRLGLPDNLSYKSMSLVMRIPSKNEVSLYDGDKLIIDGVQGETLVKNGYSLFFDSSVDLSGEVIDVVVTDRLAAIDQLRENLSISSSDQSSLLDLKFIDSDPEYAKEILNNIASYYVQRTTKEEVGKLAHGVAFIEEQLPILRDRLEEAEQALTEYQVINNTIDLAVEGDTLIKALVRIEEQLTELELEENNFQARYTESHPTLQTISRQRAALINRKLELEKSLENIPLSSQGLIRLKRDVEVNQAIYLQLLSKLQELKVIKASSVSSVQVIDTAQAKAAPIRPKNSLITIVACILGASLSSFYVLLKHFTHKRIMTIEDITDPTTLEVIATVPESKRQLKHEKNLRNSNLYTDENGILAVVDPQDLSIEALRSMRTNLFFSLKNSLNNITLISGPTENVGKSFVSSNIAVLFAQSGKRVILINADMRKGYLDKQFQPQPNKTTLSEYLSTTENISPESCIHSTKITNLYYIPAGKKPKNPAELLTDNKLSLLFECLKDYDVVLVDTPPLLPVSDTLEILPFASNIALVVRQGETSAKELLLAESKIRAKGGEISGVVINGIKKSKSRGYYSYHYSYSESN